MKYEKVYYEGVFRFIITRNEVAIIDIILYLEHN